MLLESMSCVLLRNFLIHFRYIETKNLRPYFLMDDRAMEDFAGIDTNNPNAVVIGLADSKFNYEYINHAFRLILGGSFVSD